MHARALHSVAATSVESEASTPAPRRPRARDILRRALPRALAEAGRGALLSLAIVVVLLAFGLIAEAARIGR